MDNFADGFGMGRTVESFLVRRPRLNFMYETK